MWCDGITSLVLLVLLVFLLFATPAAAQTTAGILGNTGLWKVVTPDALEPGKVSASAWYDRIHRNPGDLTASTTGFSAAVGIGRRFELGTAFEANKRVLVGQQDQLSFGQQALGFFGNKTPGSLPLPGELMPGSSLLPQLRSPATPNGSLTGAAGYYNLLPFAGLVHEGDGIGLVTAAVKWNILSQTRGAPVGFAVRGHFDVPIRKGIDYLLTHPVGTADLQYGFDGILGRNFGDVAGVYLNAGYRHINQPVHVSVIQLADEAPISVGCNVPRTSRIQFVGETTAEVFIGSHTPNTTFGPEDPVDVALGLRFEVVPKFIVSAGYRPKNGFVINAGFRQ